MGKPLNVAGHIIKHAARKTPEPKVHFGSGADRMAAPRKFPAYGTAYSNWMTPKDKSAHLNAHPVSSKHRGKLLGSPGPGAAERYLARKGKKP